jgi:hypothetical protein
MLRASLLVVALAACGHGPGGKLMVDTPILPFTPPEFDEPDPDEAKPEPPAKPEAAMPAPAPAPTPAPPPKTPPAVPAKK